MDISPATEPSTQDLEKQELPFQLPSPDDRAPYSYFTKQEKRLIIVLITFAGLFSPLSSFIYFPAITSLSSSLNVSVEKINLTITSYMIVAGIAPAVIGSMSDVTGRRFVYLLTMGIYTAANVGLALCNNWASLLVLRMVQSAGSAATIAIAYGVVSDIASPAERGSYVGAVLTGPNIAPAMGPVIGGLLVQYASWRWIFGFLAIISGVCLVLIIFFLQETSRFIVGNGSKPARGIHRTLLSYILKNKTHEASTGPESVDSSLPKKPSRIPNPLVSLRMLFFPDTIIITLVYSVYYTTFSCIQASLSPLFIQIYGLTEFQAGLIYLPFGFGAALGSWLAGKVMDRDYRIVAAQHGITVDKVRGDDLTKFPIEKARFRSVWWTIGISGASVVGYGWAVERKASLAAPLILQFIAGTTIAMTFNLHGTLLTDIHPKAPASAQAANNIVRCAMAAGGLALLQPILDHVGPGWCFTIFGGTMLGCLGLASMFVSYFVAGRKVQLSIAVPSTPVYLLYVDYTLFFTGGFSASEGAYHTRGTMGKAFSRPSDRPSLYVAGPSIPLETIREQDERIKVPTASQTTERPRRDRLKLLAIFLAILIGCAITAGTTYALVRDTQRDIANSRSALSPRDRTFWMHVARRKYDACYYGCHDCSNPSHAYDACAETAKINITKVICDGNVMWNWKHRYPVQCLGEMADICKRDMFKESRRNHLKRLGWLVFTILAGIVGGLTVYFILKCFISAHRRRKDRKARQARAGSFQARSYDEPPPPPPTSWENGATESKNQPQPPPKTSKKWLRRVLFFGTMTALPNQAAAYPCTGYDYNFNQYFVDANRTTFGVVHGWLSNCYRYGRRTHTDVTPREFVSYIVPRVTDCGFELADAVEGNTNLRIANALIEKEWWVKISVNEYNSTSTRETDQSIQCLHDISKSNK
ncbi:hypothetical protein V494_04287 [Pseudogymnoascus sp. VKM F-4513 (FW-928)]|nr:hypothetical protein V494_04287 [Pseudogymnoascus sp. VKM F-4513 (FW-928)]